MFLLHNLIMGVTAQALHGAQVCIIPRPENNYRPLALRRRSLLAVSGLILTAKLLALALVLLLPSTAELSTITNARILQLTNAERVNNGLGALTLNDKLTKAATEKAQDMINNDYFAHISPTGVTPWFWMQRNTYVYTVAGENLAIDFIQAEDVVDAWMASPSHRDNILQPDYVETGIAVLTGEYQGGTSTVVVHMFGLPIGAVRPSQLSAASALSARSQVAEEAVAPVASPVPAEPTLAPIAEPAPATVPTEPVVTLLAEKPTVQNSLRIQATAEAGSKVHIVINNVAVTSLNISDLGFAQQEIDLREFEDGKLQLTAWAENDAGQRSAITLPQELDKDTTGPQIDDAGIMFIISPKTDTPEARLNLPSGAYVKLQVEADHQVVAETSMPGPESLVFPLPTGTVEVKVLDESGNTSVAGMVDLQPSIFTDRSVDGQAAGPARINTMARRLIIAIAMVIVVLLLLAVMIKIRIQHPKMITHASLVILLAVILLLV